MPSRILFLVALVSLASACANTNVVRLGERTYRARPAGCSIEVMSEPPEDERFHEVCLLSGRGGQSIFEGKDVDALLPDLKAKACDCGADALILRQTKQGGYNWAGSADRAEATATAIRYVRRPAKRRQPRREETEDL